MRAASSSTAADPPTFSVVTAAFNAAASVAATVTSVLAQTRGDFELIVVDDGSVDGTADVVASFLSDERIRLIRQANRGPGAARNTALHHARGRLIALLDADDLWLPVFLERMAAALERRPDASLAYTQAWILDRVSGEVFRKTTSATLQPGPHEPPDDCETLMRELLRSNFVFCSVLARREAFDAVGLFDESLRAAEDYELWLRMAAHGLRMVRVTEPLAIYTRQDGTVTSNHLLLESCRREVFGRVSADVTLPASVRELALEKQRESDRRIGTLLGRRRFRHLVYRIRRRVAPFKHRYFGRLLRHTRPPEPVAAAFPDLDAMKKSD